MMQQLYCCIIILYICYYQTTNTVTSSHGNWSTIFVVAHLITTRTIFFVLRRTQQGDDYSVVTNWRDTFFERETAAMERGTNSLFGPPVAQTMEDLPEEDTTLDNSNDHMLHTRAAVNTINITIRTRFGVCVWILAQLFLALSDSDTVYRAVTKTENDHTIPTITRQWVVVWLYNTKNNLI